MLYGDWEEAYNRLPRLLGAMAATNPGMVHVVEPYGQKTMIHRERRVRVFGRAFWAFEQCVRAFQHCRPVISIDGTFLTGQFKVTLLVAIGSDANNRLLPLAFALVEAETNDNWEWFLRILRTKVLPPEREICVISDRHSGILNAVDIVIPRHAPLHHRWCMRHFCANFYRACGSRELTDDLQDCCQAFSYKRFARLYNALVANKKLDAGGLDFLSRHIELRTKWARAYDEDGRRYGQMTSNMAECFNRVLKGVRALPVTAIVQYTFDKLREYFLKYSIETCKQIAGENKKKYKFKFPPKVEKWMTFQSRKADSQTATLYNNVDWMYEVKEPGGTTNDGEQHGNRSFKVYLSECHCSCRRPSLVHLACSHLYTAARMRHVDVNHPVTVRESEFSIVTTKHTWAPRFEPYFDQSQWPEYHGVQLWPDLAWKVVKRGRRKSKRLRGDMDGWGRGGGREMGNNQFQEPSESAHCGECGGRGHNARKCTNRKKKSKKMIQGQANQVVAKQVLANKFLTNKFLAKQVLANNFLANMVLAKQVLANNFLANMVLAKQGADLDLQEDVLVGQVVVVLDVGLVEPVVAVETVLVRLGLVCVDTYEDHFRMSLLFTYLFMLLFMLPFVFTMYHCCL